MTTPEEFFAPTGPERDRWDRPMLVMRPHTTGLCSACADGDIANHRLPYTRASSLANKIDDFTYMWEWRMKYLARGLGRNPDLAALAGAEPYTTGFDKGDEKENRASGKRLMEIVERVLDREGITEKADYGTVVHALTEPGNDGVADWYQNAEDDVASWWRYHEDNGIQILGTELFCANDDLMAAGTFDHLEWVPGYGIVIVDKKTSAKVTGHSYRIQLAVYSYGELYDWETDERRTLEDYVASVGWDPALINREVGFIAWIKNGKTEYHRLDLKAGLEAARHAAWVRDEHLRGTHSWKADKDIAENVECLRSDVLDRIDDADSRADLDALWRQPETKAIWTVEHTYAAKKRKAELA